VFVNVRTADTVKDVIWDQIVPWMIKRDVLNYKKRNQTNSRLNVQRPGDPRNVLLPVDIAIPHRLNILKYISGIMNVKQTEY
jgi:hypothetical protein